VIPHKEINRFLADVFRSFYDLQHPSSQLVLKILNVRQRELLLVVGDIFLQVATEFNHEHLPYVGQLPNAEKLLKEEAERNHEFWLFLQVRALFL
jgi:hypothetical protein